MPDCIGSIEASVYEETDVWIRNMEDFTVGNECSVMLCLLHIVQKPVGR